MSLYGTLIGADDVRDALRDHLHAWSPAYIAEVARQRGLDPADVPSFQSYEIRGRDGDLESYVAVPSITFICTEQRVLRRGSGPIAMRFRVAAVIFAAGVDHETATQAVGRYVTAVIAAVEQHPDLSGFAERAAFVETRWDRVAPTERPEAWDGGAAVFFDIDVADVMDADAGPDELPDPVTSEQPAPPVTTEVVVTVEPEEA
jgi:hypothetical protein